MVKSEPVNSPEYKIDGSCIYYNDPASSKYDETQLVIRHDGKRELEIVHIDESVKSVDCDNLLRGIKGDQYKDLFTIILKQKGKLDELKNRNNMMMLPDAIMSHINFLSQTLVGKEKKIKELNELNKKEKLEVSESKRSKKESENRAESAIKENKKIGKEIIDLKKQNAQLVKDNKVLKDNQLVLESKINLLQKVSSDLTNTSNHTVVIESINSPQNHSCEECSKLKRKIDTVLKEKSSLNDQLIETNTKFDKVDKFYQDIISQKDLTIKGFTEITQTVDDVDTKFKRLLAYHKALVEIKHMQSIKEQLLNDGKPQMMDSSTNTSDMEMVDVSTNTDVLSIETTVSKKKLGNSVEMMNNVSKPGMSVSNAQHRAVDADPKLMNYIRNTGMENYDGGQSKNEANERGDESKRIKKFCWFGRNCFREKCRFNHENCSIPPKCRFGLRCSRRNCLFRHMDDCDNRDNCSNLNTCQKRHIIYDEAKNKVNTVREKKGESQLKPMNSNTAPANKTVNDTNLVRLSPPLTDRFGSTSKDALWAAPAEPKYQSKYSFSTPKLTYLESSGPEMSANPSSPYYINETSMESNDQRYSYLHPVSCSEQYYQYGKQNIYPVKRLSKNLMGR